MQLIIAQIARWKGIEPNAHLQPECGAVEDPLPPDGDARLSSAPGSLQPLVGGKSSQDFPGLPPRLTTGSRIREFLEPVMDEPGRWIVSVVIAWGVMIS